MSLNPLFQKALNALEFNKIIVLLEECAVSDDAKSKCRAILPLTDEEEINFLLKNTDDARIFMAKRGTPSFSGLKNILPSLNRAVLGSALSMKELLDIASVLRACRGIVAFRAEESEMKTTIDNIFNAVTANKYLEEKIFNSIISEEEMADNASSELYDIRRKLKGASNKIRELLNKIIHSQTYQKYLQDPIITVRGDRYVIPVKQENRNEIAGLIHDTSSSGATVFIEPMSVVEANNELKVLYAKEQKEIERILYALSAEAASFADSITISYEMACELDFIFAKAKLADKQKASMPNVNTRGFIELKKARHPLLDKSTAVPIDVVLGGDYGTLVITGPNTGGKTVTLKTIGILQVMAQSGLHIPASDNSEISVFENIYADIGDEQSIEQSLSTFSSHMTNIVKIIDLVDRNNLVLFDELGAGTDPVEGAGLAVSILEYIRSFGAKIVATTHYPELKIYALETKGVQNASCEFNVDTLKPTYRLITGIPGRSNAFAIAQRLGLNEHIIDRAKDIISDENSRFEDVLDDLEQNRRKIEGERVIAESERANLQKLKMDFERQKAELEVKLKKENEKAIIEAQKIIDEVKEQANSLINELDELRKQKDSEDFKEKLNNMKSNTKATFHKLENKITPVENKSNKGYKLPRALRVGDTVRVLSVDKEGTVQSLADSSGHLTVQVGIMKLKLKISDLVLIENKTVRANDNSFVSFSKNTDKKPAKLELNLRGMTVLEAEAEIDMFIDNAVMAGITPISIIHGKGTGALRCAVHSSLKANKSIKSFRLGKYGEGEDGVTIIELK
jgi:DNA mismatch repair protein MutS2